MRSTLQTVSAPSHLICPLSGKVLVDPVQVVISLRRADGACVGTPFHFEKAYIEQILQTTDGQLPLYATKRADAVPLTYTITRSHVSPPDPNIVKCLHEFRAKQAEQAALQAALAAAPQLVPVYQKPEEFLLSTIATNISSKVTATLTDKNPPKKEESFLQTFASLFTREKTTQPTATATVQAPSQQALATTSSLATTSPLATTTQPAVADRILLSVSQRGYLKVSFPTEAMCEKVFSGLDDANLISRRGRVLYIPAKKKETKDGELSTLCATFSSSAVLQRFAVERMQLKENDKIKFGTGEQSSHLLLSHERFYTDPTASLKIRIPKWLQLEASPVAPVATVRR